MSQENFNSIDNPPPPSQYIPGFDSSSNSERNYDYSQSFQCFSSDNYSDYQYDQGNVPNPLPSQEYNYYDRMLFPEEGESQQQEGNYEDSLEDRLYSPDEPLNYAPNFSHNRNNGFFSGSYGWFHGGPTFLSNYGNTQNSRIFQGQFHYPYDYFYQQPRIRGGGEYAQYSGFVDDSTNVYPSTFVPTNLQGLYGTFNESQIQQLGIEDDESLSENKELFQKMKNLSLRSESFSENPKISLHESQLESNQNLSDVQSHSPNSHSGWSDQTNFLTGVSQSHDKETNGSEEHTQSIKKNSIPVQKSWADIAKSSTSNTPNTNVSGNQIKKNSRLPARAPAPIKKNQSHLQYQQVQIPQQNQNQNQTQNRIHQPQQFQNRFQKPSQFNRYPQTHQSQQSEQPDQPDQPEQWIQQQQQQQQQQIQPVQQQQFTNENQKFGRRNANFQNQKFFPKRFKRRGTGNSNFPYLDESLSFLKDINPTDFDTNPKFAKFYVIKSYSEDDIHKSIKYSIWTSTDSGNKRLDKGFRENSSFGPIYLFFSVNASGQFCGVAQMMSPLDYSKKSDCWHQDKWNGQFQVKWIFIKDIPNTFFRQIQLTNNDGKPVTNSRDTQEVLLDPGREILGIFRNYEFKTSILDDFEHYEREEFSKRRK